MRYFYITYSIINNGIFGGHVLLSGFMTYTTDDNRYVNLLTVKESIKATESLAKRNFILVNNIIEMNKDDYEFFVLSGPVNKK